MISRVLKILKILGLVVAVCLLTLFAVRIYDTQRGPELSVWHTFVPEELSAEQIDATDWAGYLKAEDDILRSVRNNVTEKLAEEDKVPNNRYFAESPVYPGRFVQDWNRSYRLEPEGQPKGAAVFLHGLTDTPYSLRHIARAYRSRGFVAVAIRIPGHGTVPAGLTDVNWEDWMAATRLAVREAVRSAGPAAPLHLIGFSNGGALAVKYALDALEDESLRKPDRLVLISPMIGITAFARVAGLAGVPAIFPAFVKAAWLSILPEFNPFKYNSFPVNGARQAHQLTVALQRQINGAARAGRLERIAPALTFQSVVDFTVSTRAVIRSFYEQLPVNGSELVLYDINRAAKFGPLLRSTADTALTRLLSAPPRNYSTTIVANADATSRAMVERLTEAGSTDEQTRTLELSYPKDLFSLSHVALPFPPSDALYGSDPDPSEDFGANLGALASRGEVGVLVVALDSLLRASSNPFFDYMLRRIEDDIDAETAVVSPAPGSARTAQ